MALLWRLGWVFGEGGGVVGPQRVPEFQVAELFHVAMGQVRVRARSRPAQVGSDGRQTRSDGRRNRPFVRQTRSAPSRTPSDERQNHSAKRQNHPAPPKTEKNDSAERRIVRFGAE